ncbi:hypothetical protein WOLCODRAFT_25940 [Wolfiporia cocos MD-104 SS10]|uniref:GmrSD restriction endonucleases N-terminal domain-containing protein n=1 Tax=Wolfiporia cocos (strain MD-104) TaxID=742152 RepID=A0A2H3K359_WOLCO|nr:hypothetical protein WOLCODRAFT_25940 [Wolfiporia cocos MD-104 SS10]
MTPSSDAEKEYDELQSDLDEEEDENAFHIGARLDPPQARLYSTMDLHTLIHEGVIDLAPPYQRDVVWSEAKQIKLLDSIYRNFYVPPVVFAIYIEDGEEVRRCVDGKQRLTSIQKFFDGQIPYRDPVTKKSFWYTRAESQKRKRQEVPPQWKQDFASKQITCVEYRNLPRGFERDIFQRVQLGMPLTAAEKLQAISSPWSDWIGELDARYISLDDGLTTKFDVDMKRGRDFQTLAQLVYCCNNYPEHVVPTAPKMEQWLQRGDAPSPEFKRAVSDTMTAFWHFSNTPGLNDVFTKIKQRVAPIEFVFIGVLLYATRDIPNDQRAEDLLEMRRHVRKRFPDVRSRSDIVRCIWDYVQTVVDRNDMEASYSRSTGGKRRAQRQRSLDVDMEDYDTAKQVGKRTRARR